MKTVRIVKVMAKLAEDVHWIASSFAENASQPGVTDTALAEDVRNAVKSCMRQ